MKPINRQTLLTLVLAVSGVFLLAGYSKLNASFGNEERRKNDDGNASAILFGTCYQANSSLTGPGGTIWVIGLGVGRACEQGQSATSSLGFGIPLPSSGTLENLRVAMGANSGATATVYVNGNPTELSCAIPANSTNEITCADTAHIVTVVGGDEVAVGITPNDVGFVSNVRIALGVAPEGDGK